MSLFGLETFQVFKTLKVLEMSNHQEEFWKSPSGRNIRAGDSSPEQEQCQIKLSVDPNFAIWYNISGRQILRKYLGSKPVGLHSEQISLEGLTSGTYIYEVELNNTWRQQSTMMLIK